MGVKMLLSCTLICLVFLGVSPAVDIGTGHIEVENVIATTEKPFIVEGIANQDTDYVIVEDVSGNDKFTVSKTGAVTATGTLNAGGHIDASTISSTTLSVTTDVDSDTIAAETMLIESDSATRTPLTINPHASQSGDTIQAKNSAGTNKFRVSAAGGVITAADVSTGAATINGGVGVNADASAALFSSTEVTSISDSTNRVPMVITGHANAGSTVKVLLLEASDGTDKWYVTRGGNAYAATTVTASSFSGTIDWNDITGTPTTRSGYGLADNIGSSTQGSRAANQCIASSTAITYASVNSKPSTLTDFNLADEVGSSTEGTHANWLNSNCLTSETVTLTSLRATLNCCGNDGNNYRNYMRNQW